MKGMWLRWVLDYPKTVALTFLLLFGLAASGIKETVFLADYEVYFPEGNTHLQAYHEIEETYSKFDNIAFVVTAKEGTIFQAKTLDGIKQLTDAAWKLPFSRRVDSVTNFQRIEPNGDSLFVEDLFKAPLEYSPTEIDARMETALEDPRLQPILSRDGRVTSVNVAINLPGNEADETTPVMEGALSLAKEFRLRHPELEIRLTGSIVINFAYFTYLQSDLVKLMPIVFAVFFLFIWFLFRSFLISAAVMVCSLMAVLATFGTAAYLGFAITNAAINIPTILLAVTVASAVHVCTTVVRKYELLNDEREAIYYSLSENLQPVTLTSVTTAIGFLCLNLGDLPPYGWMGSTTAIGVAAAYLTVMVLLPAILRLLPLGGTRVFAPQVTSHLGSYIVRERKKIFITTLILAVTSTASVTRNEFNDSFIEYLDESLPERQDVEYATNQLGGLYTLSYSLAADETVADPEYLSKVDRFVSWLKQQPEVVWVTSITPTVKEINRAMNGGDKGQYAIPLDANLAAQYLLIYELSLPYGLDLTADIDIDRRESRVVAGFGNVTNKVLRDVDRRITEWLENNITEFASSGAGPSIMFAYIWSSAAKSTFFGLLVAIVAIAATAAVAFRDLRLGALTIVPNLIPPVMAYGIWGLVDGWLDVGATNVIVITFGIIVDDTIHLLTRFQRQVRKGSTAREAVSFALNETGSAIIFTTIIISLGFLALIWGQFDTNQTIGTLCFIILWVALLFDLFFLPALLTALYDGKAGNAELVPVRLS